MGYDPCPIAGNDVFGHIQNTCAELDEIIFNSELTCRIDIGWTDSCICGQITNMHIYTVCHFVQTVGKLYVLSSEFWCIHGRSFPVGGQNVYKPNSCLI